MRTKKKNYDENNAVRRYRAYCPTLLVTAFSIVLEVDAIHSTVRVELGLTLGPTVPITVMQNSNLFSDLIS